MTAEADPQRPIRSFVLRQGRVSSAQARYFEEGMPRWGIPYRAALLDLDAVFGRSSGEMRPLILEIGCGMGETTATIAAAHPENDYLGIEVHTPGVGALLKEIATRGLTNLRVVQHDAVEVVRDMLPPGSLAGIHIYFPDPWPKKRHHKRRLVQPPFVAQLAARLAPGGYLHCATDWEEYALQMLDVLGAEPLLENTVSAEANVSEANVKQGGRSQSGVSGFAPRPEHRPLTKFEQRGRRLGHGVWDVIFKRRG